MKEFMINVETKEVLPYDWKVVREKKGVVKCRVFYLKPAKNSFGYGVFDYSKKGIKCVTYHLPGEPDTVVTYLLYDRQDSLLKEYITRCGYDRGPGLGKVVGELIGKI